MKELLDRCIEGSENLLIESAMMNSVLKGWRQRRLAIVNDEILRTE